MPSGRAKRGKNAKLFERRRVFCIFERDIYGGNITYAEEVFDGRGKGRFLHTFCRPGQKVWARRGLSGRTH